MQETRRLRQETRSLHYTWQTIEIVVLQAIVVHQQGRQDKALDLLEQAVDLASPGGWIRPFVESGAPIVELLKRMRKKAVRVDFIDQILAASPSPSPP